MQSKERKIRGALVCGLVLAQVACGSTDKGGSPATGAAGGASIGGGNADGLGGLSSGGTAQDGASGSAGLDQTSGGKTSGSGGSSSGGSSAAGSSTGGSSGASQSGACTVGAWPAADPAVAGPFATVTEVNVGPATEGVAFTMFRPKDLSPTLCHPLITWGNGTGSTPSLYKVVLSHLASHGFVVIASDSMNVGQGTPAPMLNGVTWVLAQNDDPASPLYRHIDVTHIGATGHSQGGFATSSASGDQRITASAPLCGARTQRNLRGPAWLFCGGADTTVPCSTVQSAFKLDHNAACHACAPHRGRSCKLGDVPWHQAERRGNGHDRLDACASHGRYRAALLVLRSLLQALHGLRLGDHAEDDGSVIRTETVPRPLRSKR